MQSVALSQSVFLPETREQINKVILELFSLANLRGKDGLLEGEITTQDKKTWPHHLDMGLGAPRNLLLAIPEQTNLEKGQSCELYADVPADSDLSELGIWIPMIPNQIASIIKKEYDEFQKKLPLPCRNINQQYPAFFQNTRAFS